MECAQINVVGGSGTASPQTYSIPGIYKANDPGITINIYSMSPSSQYAIPGPPKFTCSGGGNNNGGGSNPSATQPATTKPATTLTTSTVKPTTSAPSGGCSVAQWGQCGGSSYTGCTTCASPYTCKAQNAYYSQCQ
jgi:cellulase